MGKTKELALKQELDALAETPGIRKDVSEKVQGIHLMSSLGSMLFGCGGAIGGIILSIPTFLIPGFDGNIAATGLSSLGMISGTYVASKWIQSYGVETLVRENAANVWDKHIQTVKDAYSIEIMKIKEVTK